jgi:hypothetical protein
MTTTPDTIAHPAECSCAPCVDIRAFAEQRGVVLFELPYKKPAPEKRRKVYKIAKPIGAPEVPGKTTVREIKSPTIKQYVKDAAAYINMLELATCGHVNLEPCKLCGGPKPEGYICCHCQGDDSSIDFG